MDIHPQYTYDKDGKAIGVFLPIEEWEAVSAELHVDLPQWQKDALDVELNRLKHNPEQFQDWAEVKKRFLP